MRDILRRASAECVGTYIFCTAGLGAIMANAQTHELTHIGVALAFGLATVISVAAIGHISGSHINPAVTIAFALTRHFPWQDVPWYVAAQFVGGVASALTLRVFLGTTANVGASLTHIGVFQGFGLEVLLTAILMFVIVSVATDTRAVGELAALTIGAAVGLNALWGGAINGISMNPARSFGPALVAGVWSDQWIYYAGPVIGACLGALLYQFLRAPKQQSDVELERQLRSILDQRTDREEEQQPDAELPSTSSPLSSHSI